MFDAGCRLPSRYLLSYMYLDFVLHHRAIQNQLLCRWLGICSPCCAVLCTYGHQNCTGGVSFRPVCPHLTAPSVARQGGAGDQTDLRQHHRRVYAARGPGEAQSGQGHQRRAGYVRMADATVCGRWSSVKTPDVTHMVYWGTWCDACQMKATWPCINDIPAGKSGLEGRVHKYVRWASMTY